jgi:hypothetical protein
VHFSQLAKFEEERAAHEARMAKTEAEMKHVFNLKVQEKETNLRQREEEVCSGSRQSLPMHDVLHFADIHFFLFFPFHVRPLQIVSRFKEKMDLIDHQRRDLDARKKAFLGGAPLSGDKKPKKKLF